VLLLAVTPFFVAAISDGFRYDAVMKESQQIVLSLPNGPIKQLLLTVVADELHTVTINCEQKKITAPLSASTAKINELAGQLCQYTQQAHSTWSIQLPESGTEFQRRVWQHLQKIPMGSTQTYGEVAKALNSSARAVGNACRANPFLLIVPCHRVVKSNNIGGFGGKVDGEAIAIKRWLLAHEKQ
jgi:methylated-DNA-[protein]-cysteine S-methyltransferase